MILTEREIEHIKRDDVGYFRRYFAENKGASDRFYDLVFEHRALRILYFKCGRILKSTLQKLRNKPQEPQKVRILLESVIRFGDNRKQKLDDLLEVLYIEEIQYLLARGFIETGRYHAGSKILSSYLLYTIGLTSRFPSNETFIQNPEKISFFYHCFSISPLPLCTRVEQLTREDCAQIVMYDNFDDRIFRQWSQTSQGEFSIGLTMVLLRRSDFMEPWIIYLMVTNGVDRDLMLLSLIFEGKMELVESLAKRGIYFSDDMEQKLSVPKRK